MRKRTGPVTHFAQQPSLGSQTWCCLEQLKGLWRGGLQKGKGKQGRKRSERVEGRGELVMKSGY